MLALLTPSHPGPGTVAGLIPPWIASRLDPVQALRAE